MFDPPYAFWSIWKGFGPLQRLFIELLFAVAAYCLFVLFRTALRLRGIERHFNERMIPIEVALAPLYRSLANTRRVIGATFYLFGFVLFYGLQLIVNTIGNPSLKVVLGGFVCSCAFAANVFFIILVLHVGEWLVYIMLNRCSKRLSDGPHGTEDKAGAVSL
jgi:hypothetical protein